MTIPFCVVTLAGHHAPPRPPASVIPDPTPVTLGIRGCGAGAVENRGPTSTARTARGRPHFYRSPCRALTLPASSSEGCARQGVMSRITTAALPPYAWFSTGAQARASRRNIDGKRAVELCARRRETWWSTHAREDTYLNPVYDCQPLRPRASRPGSTRSGHARGGAQGERRPFPGASRAAHTLKQDLAEPRGPHPRTRTSMTSGLRLQLAIRGQRPEGQGQYPKAFLEGRGMVNESGDLSGTGTSSSGD